MNIDAISPPDRPEGASPEQIEAVYRARFDQLLRVCRAIVGSDDAAHDAVQEGVARALRSRAQFGGHGSLEGWIWHAVVNAARNQRRVRTLIPVGEASQQCPPDAPDSTARELIATLPERQRMVLFLRYYADMSYETIAETLEISSGAVGAILNSAHANLRVRIEGMDA
jgi:RNA polymerase sigma-70 factor (ECF subfamily)